MKTGAPRAWLSSPPLPPPSPDFFLTRLPGAGTLSSPGPGVSHQEEAVTAHGSRRPLRGLAAPIPRPRGTVQSRPRGPRRARSFPDSRPAPSRPYPGRLNVRLRSGRRKRRPARPFPAPQGRGFPLRAREPRGPVPLTRAGIPSLPGGDPGTGPGVRVWPRRGGEGRGGEFPPPGRGAAPAKPPLARPAADPGLPGSNRCPRTRRPPPAAGRAARGPATSPGRARGTEKRGPGHLALSRLPAWSPGRGKGDKRTPGRAPPHSRTPRPAPARSLLVVAEDFVGDSTVENFLVGPQVRGRLLSHKRLSVEQRHLRPPAGSPRGSAARVGPASRSALGGKESPSAGARSAAAWAGPRAAEPDRLLCD